MEINMVVIILGMILFLAILIKPFFGLLVIVALIPQSLLQPLSGTLFGVFSAATPIKIIGGITFLSVFLRYITSPKKVAFFSMPQIKFFVLFLIYIFITGFTFPGFGTRENFTAFTSFAVIGFIILVLVNDIKRFRLVLWCGLISTFFVCISSILSHYSIEAVSGILRLKGASYDPNYFAAALLPLLGISFSCIFAEKNAGLKIAAIGITCIITFALLLSFSRAGVAGFLLMAMIAVFKARNKILVIIVLAIIFIAVSKTVPSYMWEGMRTRVIETETTLQNLNDAHNVDSTKRRYLLARAAWKMFLDYPIFGVGIGNYYYKCREYEAVAPGRAHTMYLEVMAEMGIVGFFLFVAIIWYTLRSLSKMMKMNLNTTQYSYGSYIGLIGFLVAAFFLHAQQEKILWFVVFMTAALGHIASTAVTAVVKDNVVSKRRTA